MASGTCTGPRSAWPRLPIEGGRPRCAQCPNGRTLRVPTCHGAHVAHHAAAIAVAVAPSRTAGEQCNSVICRTCPALAGRRRPFHSLDIHCLPRAPLGAFYEQHMPLPADDILQERGQTCDQTAQTIATDDARELPGYSNGTQVLRQQRRPSSSGPPENRTGSRRFESRLNQPLSKHLSAIQWCDSYTPHH